MLVRRARGGGQERARVCWDDLHKKDGKEKGSEEQNSTLRFPLDTALPASFQSVC